MKIISLEREIYHVIAVVMGILIIEKLMKFWKKKNSTQVRLKIKPLIFRKRMQALIITKTHFIRQLTILMSIFHKAIENLLTLKFLKPSSQNEK